MRCREARKKLIQSKGLIPEDAENSALITHLRHCPKCAALAKAEYTLHQNIKPAFDDDNLDIISLQELKNWVETRVRSNARSSSQEISIMKKIATQVRSRPKFGISLAAVIVILLVATMVPVKWEKTIGYKVAIAGVNKELAMNQEKVHILLVGLGMENVEYNVDGCDTTCQLTLTSLKSENDVNIVAAAFDKLGDCKLKEVVPICENQTGSLLKKMTINIFEKPVAKMKMEQIFTYVDISLDRLNELTEGDFDIWITQSEHEGGGTDVIFFRDQDAPDISPQKTDLSKYDKYFIHHITDETGEFVILENDVHKWRIDLNVEEDLQRLKELGIDIKTARLANGEFASAIYIPKTDDSRMGEMDDSYINLQFLDESSAIKCSVQEVVRAPDGSGSLKLETEKNDILWMSVTDMKSWDDLTVSTNSIIEINSADDPDKILLLVKKGDSYYLKGTAADFNGHKEDSRYLPDRFVLRQNYPNPFNPLTTVIYSLPRTEHVTIEIFNINGQKVRTLVDGIQGAGDHSVIWDSTDDDGGKVASGIYLYRLTAGEFTESRKMTLAK